jgi:hypothetical protein
MKRSEMVKALQDRFNTTEVDAIADLADEVIGFLEKKGMLPPAYESYEKIPASFMFDDVYRKIYVNEWEPENKQ